MKCYEASLGGVTRAVTTQPARRGTNQPGTSGNNAQLVPYGNSSNNNTKPSSPSTALVVVDSDSDDDDDPVGGSGGGARKTKLVGNTATSPGTAGGTPGEAGKGGSAMVVFNEPAQRKITGLSVQPQYNICEHYLDEYTLVDVLALCPQLIATYDQQLTHRLVDCHGKDERYKDPDEDSLHTEVQDFKWIMKKVHKEKEVFGLF